MTIAGKASPFDFNHWLESRNIPTTNPVCWHCIRHWQHSKVSSGCRFRKSLLTLPLPPTSFAAKTHSLFPWHAGIFPTTIQRALSVKLSLNQKLNYWNVLLFSRKGCNQPRLVHVKYFTWSFLPQERYTSILIACKYLKDH